MTLSSHTLMTFTIARIAILASLLICASANATSAVRITLVLSDNTSLYQTFADEFSRHLANQTKVTVVDQQTYATAKTEADLVVTVGIKAATVVATRSSAPLLATMITLNQHAELSGQRPRDTQISTLFLNQPVERQIALLRAALPDRTKVGFLYTGDSKTDVGVLRDTLAQQDIQLIAKSIPAGASLHEELTSVLNKSDVLFVSPNNEIYNSNTIRNILLQSYRQGVPLVGYSEALVKAGALCAAYSTPEQIAAQAGSMALQFIKNKQLPSPQYPRFFSIAVNPDVARSMGITLPSADSLKIKIGKMQGGNP